MNAFLCALVLLGSAGCDSSSGVISDEQRTPYKVGVAPDTMSQKQADALRVQRQKTDNPALPSPNSGEATPEQTQPTQTAPKRQANPRRLFQLDELETVTIKINQHSFKVWVMDEDAKRAEGMMFVENRDFADNEAMIFIYNEPEVMNFWMRNTLVDLDIAFLDKSRKIVHTATMKALDESLVGSKKPAQYAIEFRAGLLKKKGIKPGDIAEFSKPLKSKD